MLGHQRRQVTFAPTIELFLVESHCDNGNGEDGDSDSTAKPTTLWFTLADEELFKSKTIIRIHAVRRIMRLNQSGGHAPLSAAGISLLGLEKFITREVTEEYSRRRQKLMHDILEESSAHYQHHDAGSKNSIEDRLSKISAKNSEWARVQARLSALSLEIDLLADSIQDCYFAQQVDEVWTQLINVVGLVQYYVWRNLTVKMWWIN